MIYGGYFDIDNKNKRIEELEQELASPNFWDNQERSNEVILEINELKRIVKDINDLLIKTKDFYSDI